MSDPEAELRAGELQPGALHAQASRPRAPSPRLRPERPPAVALAPGSAALGQPDLAMAVSVAAGFSDPLARAGWLARVEGPNLQKQPGPWSKMVEFASGKRLCTRGAASATNRSPAFGQNSARFCPFWPAEIMSSTPRPSPNFRHACVRRPASYSVPQIAPQAGAAGRRFLSPMWPEVVGEGARGRVQKAAIHPDPCQWRLLQLAAGGHHPDGQRPVQAGQMEASAESAAAERPCWLAKGQHLLALCRKDTAVHRRLVLQ